MLLLPRAYFRQKCQGLIYLRQSPMESVRLTIIAEGAADGRTFLLPDLTFCSEDSCHLWQLWLSSSAEFLASAKWALFTLLFITEVGWKMSSFVSNSCYFKSDRLYSSKPNSNLSCTTNQMDLSHRSSVATNSRCVKERKHSQFVRKINQLQCIGSEELGVSRKGALHQIFLLVTSLVLKRSKK